VPHHHLNIRSFPYAVGERRLLVRKGRSRPHSMAADALSVGRRRNDAENIDWNTEANWEYFDQSRVFSDHKIREDLVLSLKLKDYPRDVYVEEFVRGQNMWSEVDFFFPASAFGCAQNGDKVSWSGLGIGGPPMREMRCWTPPSHKCSAEDVERIRKLGRAPYETEPQRREEPLQDGVQ
jgi:hypothetical protein